MVCRCVLLGLPKVFKYMNLLTTFQDWEISHKKQDPQLLLKNGEIWQQDTDILWWGKWALHIFNGSRVFLQHLSRALAEGRKPVFPEHPTVCQGSCQELCLNCNLILTIGYSYPYFANEEIGAQRVGLSCPLCQQTVQPRTSNQALCHFSLLGALLPPSA